MKLDVERISAMTDEQLRRLTRSIAITGVLKALRRRDVSDLPEGWRPFYKGVLRDGEDTALDESIENLASKGEALRG